MCAGSNPATGTKNNMTQNYLFIDIDGPLLPGRSHLFPQNREFLNAFNDGMKLTELLEKHPPVFDPWGVRAHNLLAKYGDAKIVIVTNWRRWATIEELQKLFKAQGLEFEYADQPNCALRGFSSERYHDIALHMEEFINEDARCLIIDDFDLKALNMFYMLEGETEPRDYHNAPAHTDDQIGIVQNRDGTVEHDIRFKWLDVDYRNGLTYEQFKLGAEFFNVDFDQLNFQEFGVPIKTAEQKAKEAADFEKYYQALIV